MNEHIPKRSSRAELEDLIRARYSLLCIVSHEEARVEESLKKLCVEREMRPHRQEPLESELVVREQRIHQRSCSHGAWRDRRPPVAVHP